ncbi:MAG: HXXEE domain-containing protein [Candidatus Heimdallarchaeota archaeon]|nr:MAG: HXXEE domain-containing protein [Candidatus Heimdallarchaeota archaeon]
MQLKITDFCSHWPKLALMLAPIITVILFLSRNDIGSYTWFFWLHIPILMLHQIEEYIFPGGFTEFANEITGEKISFTDTKTFYVNVVLGWGVFTLAAIVGMNLIWLPVALLIFMGGNAAGHVGGTILLRKYAPGFFVSLLINIPFSFFIIFTLLNTGLLSLFDLSLSIGTAVVLVFIMFLFLLKT